MEKESQQQEEEETIISEASLSSWRGVRSSYDGPGQGELLGKMSEKQHVDAVNFHGTQMYQLKKGTHKYSKMYSKDQVQDKYNEHYKLWLAHKDALDSYNMKEGFSLRTAKEYIAEAKASMK